MKRVGFPTSGNVQYILQAGLDYSDWCLTLIFLSFFFWPCTSIRVLVGLIYKKVLLFPKLLGTFIKGSKAEEAKLSPPLIKHHSVTAKEGR